MSPHKYCLIALFFLSSTAHAVTLTSDQTDFTTTSDITIDGNGISSSFSGTDSSLRTITNLNIITTGPSTSGYGIKLTGDFNQITNSADAEIITSGNSGRGISISDSSEVDNLGSITTSGTTSYGIYAKGDDNTISSSGSISTSNSSSYGINISGDSNSATNSGTISTQVRGVSITGSSNQLTNSGTITTSSSSSAHGIFISSSGSGTTNTIINSGAINSRGQGISSSASNSTITNSGTITTYDSSSIYGIKSTGDNAIITNSGTITSNNYAINNSGSGATINNSGTINGSILIGNGTLNIFGGTISGDVDGNETAGSVNIGSDSTSATFDQNTSFIDLNSLIIKSNSTLNSSSSIQAGSISLDSNATLSLSDGFSISGPITGVSTSSGILNISGTSFSPTSSIGTSSNKIANLNLSNGGSFTPSNDIFVSDILVNNGNLNLTETDNLTMFGNVTGGGSGQINIGSTSQIIDGDFTLTSGDILAVTFENSSSGNLTVNGTTTIDSNSKLAITNSSQSYIESGSSLTILNTSSGSTISDIDSSNITINGASSNSGILSFTTSTTSNSLILNINRLSSSQVTNDKNAQNIYQNINDIGAGATDKLSEFQSYLDNINLSDTNITNTLKQLAPQSTKSLIANNINIISNSMQPIENRLDKAHQDSEKNLEDGLWMQTFGSSATQDDAGDDEGYKINSFGLILATDKKINNSSIIGTALSYTKSNITSSDNLKTNAVSSYLINVYNSWDFDKYFLDGIAGFAWNQYDSNRSITAVNSKTNAKFNGQSYTAKLTTGLIQKINKNLNLTPEFTLNYVKSIIDGYSEKGANSLNLDVESISSNFLEGSAGLNLSYNTRIFALPEFKNIATNLKISYGYSFINDTPITISNFEGQNTSFETKISNIDKKSLKLETQITAYHIDNLTFSTNYTLEHKNTYQSHSISLKMRQVF